ncbi:MAG: glycosyltransferase family 2 protein [Fusobacterium sp.]|nr:glycosyltransferase family 2 protein [Fusobacterium sp.]
MGKSIFSVIIPCYNVEKYISKTIESVLNQTFNNFELILINDGSKDKTREILEFYEKQDKRIKVINKVNEGVSKTRNLGIELAKGEYLYFLDGDDCIENSLLENANLIFKNKNIEMFSFGYDIKSNQGLKICCNKKYDEKLFTSKEFLRKFLKKEISQHICSLVIKKEILKNSKFNSELITGEDLDFLMRLLLEKDFYIYRKSVPYFHYMIRENSATTRKIIPFKNLNTLDSLNLLRKQMLNKKIYEFKEYHAIRFFNIIKSLAENGFIEEDYIKIKNKFKETEYILKDLKLEFNKRSILLNILKMFYRINFKFLLFVFNINYRIKLYLNYKKRKNL